MLIALLIAAEAPSPMPMPAFLTGCWSERQGEQWTEECWTIPRGGQMMGSGRTGKGDAVGHWEWMRIERDAEGRPIFLASPKGAEPSAFPPVRATATEIEWQNASHDYPQRIVYRRTADGLDAEISLIDGSNANRWSYRLMGAAPPQK